ncbi:MAG: hypothetical protein JO040_11745 [Gemmatimonadetes bacterium]|nr:hypothetical protein [Gemmatimonadota bacterium]
MNEGPVPGCPAFLRGFPGAVLQLSPDGVVLDSNGCLDRELGATLAGKRFLSLVDRSSSADKWERALAASATEERKVWELVLRRGGTLTEPRAFSVLRDPATDSVWLVEHPRDPRLDRLALEATETNSELARTQRELSKEKARLSRALRQLEERSAELERSNRELDQFAHVVSHDLKAPLRSIGNYADWLEEDAGGTLNEAAREHLDLLRKRVRGMDSLIQGVLQYSRAGRVQAPPEPVDVGALVREIVDVLSPPEPTRVEIEPGLPTVVTERVQLEQVFQNLIGNAVKYARVAEPRIGIGACDAGDFVRFSVTDNGPGIPPRAQERIWTLFFTGRPDGEADSTGIGLSVVKKLVERHGGRAWVESEPGAGAAFYFLWPREPRPEPPAAAARASQSDA